MADQDSKTDLSWLNKVDDADNAQSPPPDAADDDVDPEQPTGVYDASAEAEANDASADSADTSSDDDEKASPDASSMDAVTESDTPIEGDTLVLNEDSAASEEELIAPTEIMLGRPKTEDAAAPVDPDAAQPHDHETADDEEDSPTSTIEPPTFLTNQIQALHEATRSEPPEVEPESDPDEQAATSSGIADQADEPTSESQLAREETPNDAESPAKSLSIGWVLLASYASAVTIVALILLMRSGNSDTPHHLESLPDVAPEAPDNLSYVPVEAELPPGHVLQIGEKQRFGNIEIEPLRIVQEPLEFTHYSDASLTRPATEAVYKLWLRVTNVSDEQEIVPLDAHLLFRWVVKVEEQREFSNYYLFPADASGPDDIIPVYRHSKDSDWDLRDQQLGKLLKPGESLETYLASSENPTGLAEKMYWRFQIRKGHSPSGNGVTTVVDVEFHTDDIQSPS